MLMPSVLEIGEGHGLEVAVHSQVQAFLRITQSTDKNRACAASTRFYQVTSLVTNPTIVAALLHIGCQKVEAYRAIPDPEL
jgi:hypothetical protein